MEIKIFKEKINFYKKGDVYLPKDPVLFKGHEVRGIAILEKPRFKIEVVLLLKKRFGKHKVNEIFEKVKIFDKVIRLSSFRLKSSQFNRADLSFSCYYKAELPKAVEVEFYFYRFL